MKWSIQIGRLFGIPINLHVTFLLLLFYLLMQGGAAAAHVFIVLLLFGCVLVHELCHSLVAIRRGVNVHSITLLPIGGVAQMATAPEKPSDEIKIALAGPLASFALAAAVYVAASLAGQAESVLKLDVYRGTLLSRLFWANVMLGALNLAPAFPMDGGRVVRGLLAMKIGMVSATRWAVTLGQAFAVLLYVAGAVDHRRLGFLILLAVFIYIGAANEEEDVEFRAKIADVPVSEAMMTRFEHLSPQMTIVQSLEVLRHSSQDEFPVLSDGKLAGMLSKNDVLSALGEMPREAVVGEIMHTDFITSTPATPLGRVFRQMEQTGKDVVPVLDGGSVAGLISYDQIGRYYSLEPPAAEAKTERA